MALSRMAVVSKIRALVAELAESAVVYAASERDEWRLPWSFVDFGDPGQVVVAVWPGATFGDGYILASGRQRHTYEVSVVVFAAGADYGDRMADAMVLVDRVIEKFASHVALGGTANSCLFSRTSGLITRPYGGEEYAAEEIILRVSEEASATPAYGG